MASVLDRYIADNPEAKKLPRDELLQKLYGQDDHDEPFETFAEELTTDKDSPLGPAAVAMGAKGMRQKELSPEATEALGGEQPERYQLWPERMVRGAAKSAIDFMKLPGEAIRGRPVTDPKTGRLNEDALSFGREGALWTVGAGGVNAAKRAAEMARNAKIDRRLNESWRPPPDNPVSSRIVPHPERAPGELTNVLDRVYSQIYDEFHAVNKGVKEVTGNFSGKQNLLAEENPYVLMRLMKGNPGRMEHWIEHGTVDFNTNEVIGPGLKQVMEPVKDNLKDAITYAVAKRAVEKEGQEIETGFEVGEAQKIINSIEGAAAKEPEAAAIVKFQKDLVQYNHDLLKYLKDSGVLSDESFLAVSNANRDYLPFYRLVDPKLQKPGPGGRSTNPIREMKGGEQEILDPIESMIRNTHAFIQIAERNRAAQALWRLATQNGEAGAQIGVEITPKVRPIELADQEINNFLKQYGVQTNNPEAFTIFRPNDFQPRPNEVVVMFDGKKRLLQVDPEIGKAWSFLDREQANLLVKVLAYPASMLRAGVVLNPGFALRNVFRDQFAPLATTPGMYIPFADAAGGLGQIWGKGPHYLEWLRSGGASATRVAIDESYASIARQKLVGGGKFDKAGQVVDWPFAKLRELNDYMENSTRVGVYKKAIEAGYSPLDAAYISRESTVDFQRMGQSMRAANMMIAFMNPNLQGVERLARAIATTPYKSTAGLVGGLTIPSLALWHVNHDDPRYKQQPRWQKDVTWSIFMTDWKDVTDSEVQQVFTDPGILRRGSNGNWEMKSVEKDERGKLIEKWLPATTENMRPFNVGLPLRLLPSGKWQADRGKAIMLPKPFELGVFFGSTLGERIPELYFKDNPEALKNLGQSLNRAFTPPWMFTFAAPFLETSANYSYFFDRPITPKSLERLLPEYQFTEYTSETAKKLAKALSYLPPLEDVSPIAIDHWIYGWTGTLGQWAVNAMDLALRKSGQSPQKVAPQWTAADLPIISSFIKRYPATSAQSIQDFYEKHQKQEQSLNSLRQLGYRPGTEEDQTRLREEKTFANVKSHYTALNTQRQFINDILRSDFSAVEKRNMIDMEVFRMIATATDGNKKMLQADPGSLDAKRPPAEKSDTDERYARFSRMQGNADQEEYLKRLPVEEQMKFARFAHEKLKMKMFAWFRGLDADQQSALLELLPEDEAKLWEQIAHETVKKPARRRR